MRRVRVLAGALAATLLVPAASARMTLRSGVALDELNGMVLTVPEGFSPVPPGTLTGALIRADDFVAPVDVQGSRQIAAAQSAPGSRQPPSSAGAPRGAKRAGLTPLGPRLTDQPIGRYTPIGVSLLGGGTAAGPTGDLFLAAVVPTLLADSLAGSLEARGLASVGDCPGADWSVARVTDLAGWSVRALRCGGETAARHVVAVGPSPQRSRALLVVFGHAEAALDVPWSAVEETLRSVRWSLPARRPAVLARDAAREAQEAGDADRALAAWTKVLRKSPRNWQAEAGRGRALLALGRVDEGRAALSRAAAIEPRDFTVTRDRLLAALSAGDDASIEELAPRARAVLPDMGLLHAALGERALERGALEDAAAHLRLAAAARRADVRVHRLLAWTLERSGAPPEAVAAWCRCQSLAARDGGATAVRLEALKGIARLVAAHPELATEAENPGSACSPETLLREERPAVPDGWAPRVFRLGWGVSLRLPVAADLSAQQWRLGWDELDTLELARGEGGGLWLTPHRSEADPEEAAFASGQRVLRGEEAVVVVRSRGDAGGLLRVQGAVVLEGLASKFTVLAGPKEGAFIEDALAALAHLQRVGEAAGGG